jgi:hypothetical protein
MPAMNPVEITERKHAAAQFRLIFLINGSIHGLMQSREFLTLVAEAYSV